MWTDVKVRNFENCVESYGKDFGVDRIQRGMFCANVRLLNSLKLSILPKYNKSRFLIF